MNNLVTGYFKKTEKYSTFRYIIELTLVAFILKILSGIVFDLLLSLFHIQLANNLSSEKDQLTQGIAWVIVSVPVFASIETLIGQWFTIWLASKFTKKAWVIILFSTLVFTGLHMDPAQMIAVLPVAAILAYTFLRFKTESSWKAFWVTTSIHSLHNYIALVLVWLTLR